MDENERESLRNALADAIGPEHAARLMERIPPMTWDELARREDLVPMRADIALLKTDVALLKTDVAGLKTDVAGVKTDVAGLKTDVAGLRTDVGELRVDVARLDERMTHQFDGLRYELLSEFRRQMLEQNRLLFFGTLGAVFTSASLAFAAVRF